MAKIESFRFWCQKVLPLVYDESLSYYELLCKVVKYLNNTIQAVNENTEDVAQMRQDIDTFKTWTTNKVQQLEDFINNYFENLDVQQEINNKLDAMAEDGSLTALIAPYVNDMTEALSDRIEQAQEDADLANERISAIASLAEGSTTGDAELLDIRLGANGKTYASAGDAVRGQFSQATDQNTASNNLYLSLLKNKNLIDNDNWTIGAFINASNGSITEANGYSYQFVPVFKTGTYSTYRQSAFGTNRNKLSCHDANFNYVKSIELSKVSEGIYNFTLTASDFKNGVCYVGISRSQTVVIALNYGTSYNSQLPYEWYVEKANNAGYAEIAGDYHYNLYEKVLVCDGDSICKGYQDKPDNLEGWYSRLVHKNSMTGKNYAVNGGTITKGLTFQDLSPRHSISDNIDSIYAEHPEADYIILEGGVNDADVIGRITEGSIPEKFGTWTNWNFGGEYDNETFCGAVEYLFYKATSYWPKKKIGFIIPMQMGTSLSSQTNRRAYFDELIKIAEKWHIPVLDLWKISQMDARNAGYYNSSLDIAGNISAGNCYADGQHPTSYGYDLMIDKIYEWTQSL